MSSRDVGFFETGRLPRQLDPTLVVDGNHFDANRVTNLHDVLHGLHIARVELADVTEAIHADEVLLKCPTRYEEDVPAQIEG
jgi:hypothetical protein